jgi:hypothetical protein
MRVVVRLRRPSIHFSFHLMMNNYLGIKSNRGKNCKKYIIN